MVPDQVQSLLFGSCRKPHYPSGDALTRAEAMVGDSIANANSDGTAENWPALLVLSGDQIYADDVAGPMLHAILQLVEKLDLPVEVFPADDSPVADASELLGNIRNYYGRDELLPANHENRTMLDVMFGGVRKPIFTTDTAHNHLMSLNEVLAMYLLVWSPYAWQGLELDPPDKIPSEHMHSYRGERQAVEEFIKHLPAVSRLFAHLPIAMIFDDHDVTDDWNLSREWEQAVYEHDFSRRVVGNALIGYLINQAWGNNPDAFNESMWQQLEPLLRNQGSEGHDKFINELLDFEQWHYQWPTSPPLVVIDSRTRRWRSEVAASQPSGLMDWEALTDLQQTLKTMDSVILVSPAPIFGVKLIEIIQRVFSWFGKSLMVDAENWMAHPGAANTILNIFRHRKTPPHFVILSGDVHYSFVYDVELRGHHKGPEIWQICSSGLRNEFPARLLSILDHVNRWLFSPRSPLNWFTRRRRMRVAPRKPEGTASGRRLFGSSSIGLIELDDEGIPTRIMALTHDGHDVEFKRREEESVWD